MHLFDVVLFLHIATALGAFFLAGVIHTSEYLVRGVTTVEQLRLVTRPQKLGPLFAVLVVGLFGFGSWMIGINDEGFRYGDGWVWTAIVVLVFLFATGPLVMGRHFTALDKALDVARSGPVTPQLRALATHPVPWAVGHASTFMALSVVLNMVTKPSTGVAVLDVLVGASLGVLVGSLMRGWTLQGSVSRATGAEASPA
jgi:hypothetical protein